MEFRKSVKKDVDSIMRIIEQAQDYFKKQGVDQWQNDYPNQNTINNDIKDGESYVLEKDGCVVATAMVTFKGEQSYDSIYDGGWISNNEYATIHRVAVDNNYKGLGLSSQIIKNIENLCLQRNILSIKVDTHEDNLSMQKLLFKSEFKYCGIIYLDDNSKRIAFEKILF
ncbi:GNAT family N-acetyltransferase [Paraclostridium ghonii]|uniref:GNAT family N-acyltransferase n=1 Tax=Paraclostridium ghonii TaxID=29358 RepID=A0ABU0MYB0_9FIRM|nr:GNAT family N-acetyltransferase [Paeniclostridium ghonii]MDQ0555836.1 putative GNAT family N-acyltransferase [Paeniclostridium ghonii]